MSTCGNCGSQQICTCSFISDGLVTLTGDGRSYAPINYRPNNVPLPRPYGFLLKTSITDQIFPASSVEVPIIFDRNQTPFDGGMVVPPQQGGGLSIDRLVAPVAGYYLISGFAAIDTPAAAANDVVSIKKNGTTVLASQIGSMDRAPRSVVVLDQLAANDYIQLVVSTPAGGNSITENQSGFALPSGCETSPVFWAQWMRAI